MAGVNKVILVGNLGAKPELRHTGGGTPVTELRLATAERRKDGDNWVEHTEWHSVIVWSKQAENCERYLDKGSQVYVEGRLQTRSWEQDGQKRYKTEVVANTVQFLSGGGRNDQGGNQRGSGGGNAGGSGGGGGNQGGSDRAPVPNNAMDDDIPF